MTECPECDGDGYLEVQANGPDPARFERVDCPTCDGSGEADPEELRREAAYRADEARWQDDRAAFAG